MWPCPGEPGKARFVLCDEEEVKLWRLLEDRGLSMDSDLTLTKVSLKETLEGVEVVHHAVIVDLPRTAEVSLLRF